MTNRARPFCDASHPRLRRPARIIAAMLILAGGPACAVAQTPPRPRITSVSQLPPFTYPAPTRLEDVVSAPASAPYRALAMAVRRDVDSVLRTFDIADRGLERDLEGSLLLLDMMEGREQDARRRIARRRTLADKVGGRLVADAEQEAMLAARHAAGVTTATNATSVAGDDAYRREATQALVRLLRALPFDSVANELREAKADLGYMSEGMILGDVRGSLGPLVARRGALELSTARELLRARFALLYTVPLASSFVAAYDSVLAGRTAAAKPDIWAARNVSFVAESGLAPVRIGIWDSGLDTALFSRQLQRDAAGLPVLIGFDQFLRERNTPLADMPPSLLARQEEMNALFRGMSDLEGNVDSPDAVRVRARLASLPADSASRFWEEVDQWNGYSHGTAVTSIAVDGNPAARVVLGRMQFSHTDPPDPCPSRASAEREAAMLARIVVFFRDAGVRVVNMSWGRSERGFLGELSRCAPALPAGERAAIARYAVDTLRRAMIAAMSDSPDILFVAAAGNAGNNTEFNDFALRIDLPNMLLVGAVDQAGDEVSFTNVGALIRLYANGYQVRTLVPGGGVEMASGTSFAAPAVVNVAAKLLALQPGLSAAELRDVLLNTADLRVGGAGRELRLMHPARAVEAVRARRSRR